MRQYIWAALHYYWLICEKESNLTCLTLTMTVRVIQSNPSLHSSLSPSWWNLHSKIKTRGLSAWQLRCLIHWVWYTAQRTPNDLDLTFDLGFPLKVKSRSQTCQGAMSHKWCIIWSKFVWNTYNKSYMAFQFTFNIWPLMKLKWQIKVIEFQQAIHKLSTFWP